MRKISLDKKSLSDKVRELAREKIESGFVVKDENSVLDLRNIIFEELNVPKGNIDRIKKIILQVLKEKNIVLPDVKSTEALGSVRIETSKPDIESGITKLPEQALSSGQEQVPSTLTPQTQIIWDEKKRESYQKDMGFVFGEFLGTIYIKLGIIEGEEPKEEKLTPETFKKEALKFGHEVGDYCFDKRVNLPELLRLLTLIGSGFFIFVMPVINALFFKLKKVEPDKDLKEHKTEVHL